MILDGALARIRRGDTDGVEIDPTRLGDLVAKWNAKYGRAWTEKKHGLNILFRPSTVLAWRENEARTNAEGSGKWVYG